MTDRDTFKALADDARWRKLLRRQRGATVIVFLGSLMATATLARGAPEGLSIGLIGTALAGSIYLTMLPGSPDAKG